ncbi:MAG: hypothetical protein Q9182_007522 [Xanthomendoza sp. 2 TL-2023]
MSYLVQVAGLIRLFEKGLNLPCYPTARNQQDHRPTEAHSQVAERVDACIRRGQLQKEAADAIRYLQRSKNFVMSRYVKPSDWWVLQAHRLPQDSKPPGMEERKIRADYPADRVNRKVVKFSRVPCGLPATAQNRSGLSSRLIFPEAQDREEN